MHSGLTKKFITKNIVIDDEVAGNGKIGVIQDDIGTIFDFQRFFRRNEEFETFQFDRKTLPIIPFHDFFRVRGFFNPLFNTMGNLALFVPLGILLGVWWVMHGRWSSTAGEPVRPVRGAVQRSAVIGFFFSLGIEITQFILGVGYSDISDLLLNTLGAMLGAWLAVKAGVPWHKTLVTACLILAIIGILLLLGVGQWVMDTFGG